MRLHATILKLNQQRKELKMKVSLDLPDVIATEILKDAQTDGHNNRSAVIRKAITFYLSSKSHKVALKHNESRQRNTSTTHA